MQVTTKRVGGRTGNASEAVAPDSGLGAAASSGRPRAWVTLAALLVVGGVGGAVFAAGLVARNDAQDSRQSFERSSREVSLTLHLAIQHEEDLAVTAGAFILDNPDASIAEFTRWLKAVRAFKRYPELSAAGGVVIVPAKELPAFASRAVANPTGPLAADGSFKVTPPGNRPYYCLATVSAMRDPALQSSAGLDMCANPLVGPSLLAARDSGESSYLPLAFEGAAFLAVQTPIYRGGVTPSTTAARREGFLSWVGVTTVPKLVLDRALQGHPNMAVAFRYRNSSSDVLFRSGKAPLGAQSMTIDLHNGWTVQTSGAVDDGGILGDGNALRPLIGGILLSFLLGALLFVLGTGRARAFRLVNERTAQLRGAQSQVVEAARQAGMAEIATNVLHNVGNVLNSVNVSADLMVQKVRESKSMGLMKAVALMDEHAGDLGEFLTTDARGKALPAYLDQLAVALAIERESLTEELLRLTNGVTHIKEIVASQQSLAGVVGVIESVNVNDLMEDALRISGVSDHDEVTVIRHFPGDLLLKLDKHRVLTVLVNLISNATHAMTSNVNLPRQLSLRVDVTAGQAVRFSVADNGEGIQPEDLTRIFVHGFTTHTGGHGFGLHSSAMAAKEMGGGLTAHSDGAGTGAVFTLEVPLERQPVLERQLVTT